MQPTRSKPHSSSPHELRWKALSPAERRLWTAWRAQHPDPAWAPLCQAILESGFTLPPTPAEADILWPLVDARPNEAAEWFRECAKPQGSLRLQPSWALVLRTLDRRWMDVQRAVPADEDADWRQARADREKAIDTLRRIGWYR